MRVASFGASSGWLAEESSRWCFPGTKLGQSDAKHNHNAPAHYEEWIRADIKPALALASPADEKTQADASNDASEVLKVWL